MGDHLTVTRYPAGARPAEFWCAMGPMFASAAVRRALQTIHDDAGTDDWFVATDPAGAVVSFACLRRGKDPAAAELCHCYTAPEHRSAGANARVKAELMATAKAAGVKKLTATASLTHKPGLEACGFRALKQQPKKKWDYTVMEAKL